MSAKHTGALAAKSGRHTVGFNLLWLVPGVVGGTEVATTEMLSYISEDPPEDIDYRLYALAPFAAAYPELIERFPTRLLGMSGRAKPLRVAAEGSWLTRAAQRDRVDLIHHGGGNLPFGSRHPAVVTIHDLQPFDLPQYFSSAKRAYLQWSVPRAARHARLILTLSEFVRQRVVERFSADPERVMVVRAGVGHLERPDIPMDELRSRFGLPERWFVYPAITYPHKNHATLVRAFAEVAAKEPDVALVLTGRAASAEAEILHDVGRLGLGDRVLRPGRVSRDEVLGLIAGAVGLTFPSRYEGFGIPVLEAMALDTPVVAAAATALPEVVGDAGLLVPPDDVDGWAAAMLALLSDTERPRWQELGRARAAKLSVAAATQSIIRAHRVALSQSEER